jgi:SAM-dependent methyltransferase
MLPSLIPDHDDALKARQRDERSFGDDAVIGTTLQITGEHLCETIDVAAGECVLDVAAGSGNAALAAARRGCQVTACDYVPELLEHARRRAAAEGFTLDAREADAEALPFPDAAFDVVLSAFGVMFTPQPERAVAELLRVCRPGGRIGLANWTPDGFIGQVLKLVTCYVPLPPGVPSPLEWGTKARAGELFGMNLTLIGIQPRQCMFRSRSPQHWFDAFCQVYGPTRRALAVLSEDDRAALERDLLALATAHNTSPTGSLRIASDYIEVLAVKR